MEIEHQPVTDECNCVLTLLCDQLCDIHEVPQQGLVALISLAQTRQPITVLGDHQEVCGGLQAAVVVAACLDKVCISVQLAAELPLLVRLLLQGPQCAHRAVGRLLWRRGHPVLNANFNLPMPPVLHCLLLGLLFHVYAHVRQPLHSVLRGPAVGLQAAGCPCLLRELYASARRACHTCGLMSLNARA